MYTLAVESNAINLSQGFTNFLVDEQLINVFKENASLHVYQYAPMSGLPKLLQEIVSKIKNIIAVNWKNLTF